MSVLVEACVTTQREALGAEQSGADRLELCRDLSKGGLSPQLELVERVVGEAGIPVVVMVRPRAGSFVYTGTEVATMETEIESLRRSGASGVALGLLTPTGQIDLTNTRRLVEAAQGLPVTFHRAFDQISDQSRGLETLRLTGVTRVLTGGGPGRAIDQADALAALVRSADDALVIVAAGGVRGDHVESVVQRTGAAEVHSRAEGIPGVVEALRGGVRGVHHSSSSRRRL